MVSVADILQFSGDMAERFRPDRIILFGSYGYGTPTEDSDVDLLVVIPCAQKEYQKAAEISLALGHPFPVDLLVRTPQTLRQRLAWNDFFLKEIVEKGIVLYDAADARVGREGRRRLQQRLAPAAIA